MFIDKMVAEMHQLFGNPYVTLIILAFLIRATITDTKSLKISNRLNLAFLVTRLVLIPWIGFSWASLGGGILGFLTLFIPAMVKTHPMGGDIKFVGVLGLFLGFYITSLFVALSCVYGLVYGIVKFTKFKKVGIVPFAPLFLMSYVTLWAMTTLF